MSEATPFQALKGEGDNEPLIDEGGPFILPEFQRSAPFPPIPAPPVPAVVRLCPGVECCDASPFAYSIRRTPPSLTVDGTAGGDPLCSTCLNESYSATITATGIGPGLTWTIDSGFLPPGLTFHGGYNEDGEVLIDGTPTSGGNYSITVKATSPTGAFVTTTFPFNVFGITTTSLPAYTVGQPYTFQLTAAGGSGNYGWAIESGSLPDGLSFNANSGLIYGTPTGLNTGILPIVFQVFDLTCEAFQAAATPPHVSLVTSSNTIIATVLGWDEYIPSTPPKKYHNLTWSGYAEQIGSWLGGPLLLEYYIEHGLPLDTDPTMAWARYEYSGTATIDTHGNQISTYSKKLFTPCPDSNFRPSFYVGELDPPASGTLTGYCWALDPQSCASCSFPPTEFRETQLNSPLDYPRDIIGTNSPNFVVFTATTLETRIELDGIWKIFDDGEVPGFTNGMKNVPRTTVNGIFAPWAAISDNAVYSAVLSDEYTDAEALANAVHFIGNSRKAESLPRTTGFVSRWTTVNYDLDATNLTPGQNYAITVVFVDQNSVKTSQVFNFTATGSTHTINAQVPTPPDGGSYSIMQPTIALA